jgi:hypothetical protein
LSAWSQVEARVGRTDAVARADPAVLRAPVKFGADPRYTNAFSSPNAIWKRGEPPPQSF